MKNRILMTVMGCLVLAQWTAGIANEPNDTISAQAVRLAGLQIQWYSQIENDASRDTVVDVDLHVHDDQATTFYEILYDGQREVVAFTDLDARGEVYGQQGAEEWVKIRREVLEAEGRTVEVNLLAVPKTTLYAITGSGLIQAIDAETGRTRWKQAVGKRSHPTTGLAANNQVVVAVKGSQVFCLKSDTGELLWSRPTKSAPAGGIGISDTFAYVTTVAGFVRIYPLNETGIPIQTFISAGRAVNDPYVTATTVSWPTEKGHYNVAPNDSVGISYRLKTDTPIYASGTAAGGNLIVNSSGGKVFAVKEKEGVIAWEFAVGDRLIQAPVSAGSDMILIITLENVLIALNAENGTGYEGWPARVDQIARYLGASKDVLYFLDGRGNLVGLRRETGNRVVNAAIGQHNMIVANHETDRLYIGDESGALVCLREITNVNPFLHGDRLKAAMKSPMNPFDLEAGDGAGAGADPFSPIGDAGGADNTKAAKPADKTGDPFAEQDPSKENKKDDKKNDGGDPFDQ